MLNFGPLSIVVNRWVSNTYILKFSRRWAAKSPTKRQISPTHYVGSTRLFALFIEETVGAALQFLQCIKYLLQMLLYVIVRKLRQFYSICPHMFWNSFRQEIIHNPHINNTLTISISRTMFLLVSIMSVVDRVTDGSAPDAASKRVVVWASLL